MSSNAPSVERSLIASNHQLSASVSSLNSGQDDGKSSNADASDCVQARTINRYQPVARPLSAEAARKNLAKAPSRTISSLSPLTSNVAASTSPIHAVTTSASPASIYGHIPRSSTGLAEDAPLGQLIPKLELSSKAFAFGGSATYKRPLSPVRNLGPTKLDAAIRQRSPPGSLLLPNRRSESPGRMTRSVSMVLPNGGRRFGQAHERSTSPPRRAASAMVRSGSALPVDRSILKAEIGSTMPPGSLLRHEYGFGSLRGLPIGKQEMAVVDGRALRRVLPPPREIAAVAAKELMASLPPGFNARIIPSDELHRMPRTMGPGIGASALDDVKEGSPNKSGDIDAGLADDNSMETIIDDQKAAQSLSENPETMRILEGMMRDIMLGTIERHTEKIVSAISDISNQRVEDISKRTQQAEERFCQMMAIERQEREDMRKSMLDLVDQTRVLAENGIAKESARLDAATRDFVTFRLQLQSLCDLTAEVGPELQNVKLAVADQTKDITSMKQQIFGLASADTGGTRLPSSDGNFDNQRREYQDCLGSMEALRQNVEALKDRLKSEMAQEKARINGLILDVQQQVQNSGDQSGGVGGTPNKDAAQAKAFKSVLDQRIKDVATTIDQVVKDFAQSLEAERTQRQEGDRKLDAMHRDLNKHKDRLEGLLEDFEGLRQSTPQTIDGSAEIQDRWEKAMYACEDKLQEVVARIGVVEEGCLLLTMQKDPAPPLNMACDGVTQEVQISIEILQGRVKGVEDTCSSMLELLKVGCEDNSYRAASPVMLEEAMPPLGTTMAWRSSLSESSQELFRSSPTFDPEREIAAQLEPGASLRAL